MADEKINDFNFENNYERYTDEELVRMLKDISLRLSSLPPSYLLSEKGADESHNLICNMKEINQILEKRMI